MLLFLDISKKKLVTMPSLVSFYIFVFIYRKR